MERRTERALATTLALLLAGTGTAKLLGGHDPSFALQKGLHYSVAFSELLLAAGLLLGRMTSTCLIGALGIATGGAALVVFSDRPCGCLGAWLDLERRSHAVLTAAMGLISLLLLQQTILKTRKRASP